MRFVVMGLFGKWGKWSFFGKWGFLLKIFGKDFWIGLRSGLGFGIIQSTIAIVSLLSTTAIRRISMTYQ